SYKKGIPKDTSGNGGGYVFDCRSIYNPGRFDEYKNLTGLDAPVKHFIESSTGIDNFLKNVYSLIDSHLEIFLERKFTHLSVFFGCTGGQHRSVYCAESLANHISEKYDVDIEMKHRELTKS
ncbi:MAG: phosphotransferase, partial [Prevotellaceae bacterium]|nr:phosphotransferase [Prevotellaceae bacterium]